MSGDKVSPEGLKPVYKSNTENNIADIMYTSEQLLQGCQEIIITHEGYEYRLRHTSKGKLILTK